MCLCQKNKVQDLPNVQTKRTKQTFRQVNKQYFIQKYKPELNTNTT